MRSITLGLSALLLLGAVTGPTTAQQAPAAQAIPQKICDYSLVFDDCEGRSDAPAAAGQITAPNRAGAADPDDKRVAEFASSRAAASTRPAGPAPR